MTSNNLDKIFDNTYYIFMVTSMAWYMSCISHYHVTKHNISHVVILKRHPQVWLLVNLTRPWEGSNGLVKLTPGMSAWRPKRFTGRHIAFLSSAAIILATASVAAMLLKNLSTWLM